MCKTNPSTTFGPLLATYRRLFLGPGPKAPVHFNNFNGVVSVRISIVLLTATGLLVGCSSNNTTSTTPSPRTGKVVVVSTRTPEKAKTNKPAHATEKKAEKAEKKAEKAENKADKKAEKASDKSEKASVKAAQKSEKAYDKAAEKSDKAFDKAAEKSEKAENKSAHASNKGPRHINVPPGHYPPEGMCRLWFQDRAPGQQPQPTECNKLRGKVPAGAFVLYNGKYWDADYDWTPKKASMPEPLVTILISR